MRPSAFPNAPLWLDKRFGAPEIGCWDTYTRRLLTGLETSALINLSTAEQLEYLAALASAQTRTATLKTNEEALLREFGDLMLQRAKVLRDEHCHRAVQAYLTAMARLEICRGQPLASLIAALPIAAAARLDASLRVTCAPAAAAANADARCLRLTAGPVDTARAETDVDDDAWERLCAGTQDRQGLRAMHLAVFKGRRFDRTPQVLYYLLRGAAAHPRGEVPKLRSLRLLKEQAKDEGYSADAWRFVVTAVASLSIENESERGPAIGAVIAARHQFPDIEFELLYLAAAARQLGVSENGRIARVLYSGACQMLTGGAQADLYHCFASPASAAAASTRELSAAGRIITVARAGRSLLRASKLDTKTDEFEAQIAKLRQHLAILRGPFIKLSQLAPLFEQVLPSQILAQLREVPDRSPSMLSADADAIIRREFGKPPLEVFRDWTPLPFAVASFGQVHKATLHDGTPVAVKVQFPDNERKIRTDLGMARLLAPLMRRAFPALNYVELIDDQIRIMNGECDYLREAAHQEHCRQVLLDAGLMRVRIPRTFASLTTKNILTSEFVDGVNMAVFRRIASPTERSAALHSLLDAYMLLVAQGKVGNYDPHPGNHIFTDDATYLIDFGAYFDLSPLHTEFQRAIFDAMADGTSASVHRVMTHYGFFKAGAEVNETALKSLLTVMHFDASDSRPRAEVLHEFGGLIQNIGPVLRIPPPFLPMIRQSLLESLLAAALAAEPPSLVALYQKYFQTAAAAGRASVKSA